jgi:hypothetical protein
MARPLRIEYAGPFYSVLNTELDDVQSGQVVTPGSGRTFIEQGIQPTMARR